MIAGEAVLGSILSGEVNDVADAGHIAEKQRRAGALNRHQVLRQLVDDHRRQQHHQAHNGDLTTACRRRLEPVAKHQAPHRQQRAGVEGAIVDDRQQPGVSAADADAMVKEMEDRGVNRRPRAVVGWQIPGAK